MFGNKQKKEDKFISLIISQTAKTVEGIRLLRELIEIPSKQSLERLDKVEKEADEIRRILIDELNKTFITPMDREDLFNISLYVDDMLDYAYSTLEEMVLLKVEADDFLREMISLVAQAAEELHLAAQRLSNNQSLAGDHARRAKKLEGEVDHLYRKAVAELFADIKDLQEVSTKFFRREVYRHVSNMSDRADTAANLFGMVVMKLS